MFVKKKTTCINDWYQVCSCKWGPRGWQSLPLLSDASAQRYNLGEIHCEFLSHVVSYPVSMLGTRVGVECSLNVWTSQNTRLSRQRSAPTALTYEPWHFTHFHRLFWTWWAHRWTQESVQINGRWRVSLAWKTHVYWQDAYHRTRKEQLYQKMVSITRRWPILVSWVGKTTDIVARFPALLVIGLQTDNTVWKRQLTGRYACCGVSGGFIGRKISNLLKLIQETTGSQVHIRLQQLQGGNAFHSTWGVQNRRTSDRIHGYHDDAWRDDRDKSNIKWGDQGQRLKKISLRTGKILLSIVAHGMVLQWQR
jgi:hypothetical protein